MSREREVEFTVQLWSKLNQYLSKYAVNGHKLVAKEPNSVVIKGKVPDIVVTDSRGLPLLIVETKRKIESGPGEELLNPLGPAPIAQALCYAALALEEYKLEITPLFATANKGSLILFKGVEKDKLSSIIDINLCLEPKRSSEDWVRALKPGGLETILKNYIIDGIDDPLKDESIKKLFDYVGKWFTRTPIPPTIFYKVFVAQLRSAIENLHEYVRDAVKERILSDRNYFIRLFREAEEIGYPLGLLSKGLLELKCPEHSRKVCEYLKEVIESELSRLKTLTPDKAFEILSNLSRKHVAELCSEAEKAKNIVASSTPICRSPKRVEDLISFENLTKMMSYVLANKILAYKILELHYGDIPELKPVHFNEIVEINDREFRIASPNDLIEMLNYVFSYTSSRLEKLLGVKDFTPIFKTGLYDEIVVKGVESINRVNAVIDLADSWKRELKVLPGIIGYVYEGLLPPRERHQLGQFYTPPAIARLITRWAIRTGNDRILDAGCGSGTFLIEAYKRLLKLKFGKDYDKGDYPGIVGGVNEHQEVLNRLYGVDINAFAAHLTAIHLMLMEPKCPISKLNIETRDFFTLKAGEQVFGGKVPEFDAVIGNPPYTRWVEIPDETKNFIQKMLGDEIDRYDLKADVKRGKEPGIYVYWIMHAAKNLLKERGRIGMIISNMWLQTDYGVDFGRFLLDNFRITALIDLSFRLFEALISTVIILAEKESDESARRNNVVTLIRVPPRIKGLELDLEKAGKLLDESLRCIEDSIRDDGSLDAESLTRCRKEYGIWFSQIKQGDVPRDRKWISLFFERVEDIVNSIENHHLVIRLGEWFEPSYGNAFYLCLSSWKIVRGVRNLGAKDFFYFSTKKIGEWENKLSGFKEAIKPYLVPAITRSQYVKTFTFTKADWNSIERRGKNAYIFMCREQRDSLPQQIQTYIRWGETECKTKIRKTRGGGKICSEAEACKARAGNPDVFRGWYDLGGYIPTPLMAVYQPRYHPQFFYVEISEDWSVATYHAIITFIPKVKIKAESFSIDPRDFIKKYPRLSETIKPVDIELDEVELKAILAYLNSTFMWLWLEQNARYIAKGPLGLEVDVLRKMPLLDVKRLRREDVEELAKLFDELENMARKVLSGGVTNEKGSGEDEEEGGPKLEMVRALKPVFQKIDLKISELLGTSVDVEWLWSSTWEMMERRVKGAKGPTRPGAEASVEIDVGGKRGRDRRSRKRSSSSGGISLDRWFKPGSS